jgi:glycosyltransferase involved in cell wall biosynthesis
LGEAVALLHLINFDEPFGLSVVESLAAGTPVITRARGSMPEIVRDGVTGFLVDDVASAVDAVKRVGDLERSACRADAVERFGADRMVDEYERLFAEIAAARA